MFARRYPLLGKARGDEIARGFAGLLRPAPAELFSDGYPGSLTGNGQNPPASQSDSEFLLGIAHSLSGDASQEITPGRGLSVQKSRP
jgi:hypothetical protein